MAPPSSATEPRRRGLARAARVLAAFVISGGAVSLLAAQVDWQRALDALASARFGWIAVSVAWSLAIVWGRGLRWSAFQPEPGLGINTAAISVQTFYNRIAPMRLGELTLPFLLRRHAGQDASRTLVLLIVVRIVELAVLIGLLALSTLLRTGTAYRGWLAVLVALLAAIALLLARFRAVMRLCLRMAAAMARWMRVDRLPRVKRAFERIEETILGESQLSGRQRASVLLWTVALQAMQMASIDAIVRAFGVELNWLAVVQATSLALAGPALPLPSVGMVGTLEASWTVGYVWVGVGLDTAILTGIVTQVLTLLFAAAAALPAWLYLIRRSAARTRPPSRS
ncbi:MAG TPA: lysylphosphatidylglycerol synthase transmembrane domain-containing protein [Kofleriaceae bacterium]|nr:lysylphosphatidylglycerol synthase transmembrane domain-containing protein [Kofleriaceae bacterium]